MKVLVIGSGGREHALVWALQHTATASLDLYCAPGNPGIAELARCVPIPVDNHDALIAFVQDESIDLTIVGPEAPLAAGIVDKFHTLGLVIAGPSAAAARLEASKAFAKDFMARHGIPTATYEVVRSAEEVAEVLASGRFGPEDSAVVLKADGLAAGKGVVVASSHAEARAAAAQLVAGELIDPSAAQQIVVEEVLVGTEVSLLLFADGSNYALMPAARDHKRIGEHDTGPNTGGMGAITDSSILSPELRTQVVSEIVEPTLAGARKEGFPFRGVLFLGLMLTSKGPKLLEYNVRFGDPETQAILVRLKTSLVDIFRATINGNLSEIQIEWSNESSACVVLASRGYPGKYEKGTVIKGLEARDREGKTIVFHAGTAKLANGDFVTDGGRVLGITAKGDTLDEALRHCYSAAQSISWDGMQYRRDIGQFGEVRSKTSNP
ncbi:MAG TPA: phosphoribosylamine--glycine ligase [Pyrinomonadaceae bacterium]|nr:phosphoribosylamine--glycine ligase [Pyrinomonadaceae bacterium]